MKLTRVATAALCVAVHSSSLHAQVPPLDHVVVVIMENHSYDEVRLYPYTASLILTSSTCTQSHAVTHPSLPNYLALWSGRTFGITNDNCPADGSPFTVDNLGHACEVAGKTWRSYSEELPAAGDPVCSYGGYRRKHAPWTDFSNLDHMNERPLSDLQPDIAAGNLPMLAFVVPNQCNSTHDCPVATGDAWLSSIMPTLIEAVGSRGVVIVTWDEDDGGSSNHILTLFAGESVKAGYAHAGFVNHYTVLRTICDALGIAPMGAAANADSIGDIWRPVTGVNTPARDTIGVTVVPNPFNPQTSIHVSLPRALLVTGAIYAIDGSRVASLLDHETLPSGDNEVRWDGRNARGQRVASGVYFFRLTTALGARTARLVLVE
jgi:phosphatidylinositol-3-phosphatase